MTDRPARHVYEEHTGEVRLRIEAATLAGIFEQAARALAELMLGDAVGGAPDAEELVRIEAGDREALLVDWINELIFLSETRKRVYTDVTVTSVSDRRLEARVRGVFPAALRTAVKAATLHDLRIEQGVSGYSATIVLDV
jgi:SHS2 domain-containing protein